MSKIQVDEDRLASISIDHLRAAIETLCIAAKLSKADASVVADAIILSHQRGVDTHGVRALPNYIRRLRAGSLNPAPDMKILKETPISALLDADNAIGHVAGFRAMEIAIKKAKEIGVGLVAVRNSNHFGMTAYFSMLAQKEGLIGFGCTNAGARMAPTGGTTPCYGNDPWSFAFPYSEDGIPVVVDMANSVVANSNINIAKKLGTKIPTTWALTKDGEVTDDPNQAVLLQPFGGYKGYAISVVVEALTGALAGSAFSKDTGSLFSMDKGQKLGHFFMALDVGLFGTAEDFKSRMDEFCRTIKSSGLAVGSKGVYLPGEMEYEKLKKHVKEGYFKIPKEFVNDLNVLAREIGADVSLPVE